MHRLVAFQHKFKKNNMRSPIKLEQYFVQGRLTIKTELENIIEEVFKMNRKTSFAPYDIGGDYRNDAALGFDKLKMTMKLNIYSEAMHYLMDSQSYLYDSD